MTIAEIISEIDAYLISLRHARELLLVPKTGPQRKMPNRGKKKVQPREASTAVSSSARIPEKKTRSNRPVVQGKNAKEPVALVSRVPSPVTPRVADPERPAIAPAKVVPQR